jgi:hypothetical protein
MRKIAFGFLWFIALWFGALMLGGAIFGSLAASGASDTAQAMELSRKAGEQFGIRYSGLILVVALLVSVIGSWTGKLPGTATKPQ